MPQKAAYKSLRRKSFKLFISSLKVQSIFFIMRGNNESVITYVAYKRFLSICAMKCSALKFEQHNSYAEYCILSQSHDEYE